MNSRSSDARSRSVDSTHDWKVTRRAVLAAGGAVTLGGLAGCSAIDDLLDSGKEQLVGTTASSPAAFYAGVPRIVVFMRQDADSDNDGLSDSDEPEFFAGGETDVRQVPATVQAEGQEVELEGWAVNTTTKAQDDNSSLSNKTIDVTVLGDALAEPNESFGREVPIIGDTEDESNESFSLELAIQDTDLGLMAHTAAALGAVDNRDQEAANTALDALIDATVDAPENEGSVLSWDGVVRRAQRARNAVEKDDWETAARELSDLEALVFGDIERLDDELVDSQPGRPRFSDIIAYMRDEPTIGERFTVCLPDAKLPGDNGSLAEALTLDRVLAYFAPSREPDGVRAPFHEQYGTHGIRYNDDGVVAGWAESFDGRVHLHEDMASQDILSAELDTYTTANRAIVGVGTEGGAVVSAASALSDPIGKRVFLATDDVTGEIILGEDRDMVMPGDNVSNSQTLVCPVTVTPADSPSPLPGLFYVRRVVHDDQIIFAGGWHLDEGALYEDSATLLFDEGPTEVASVTPEDIESDNYDDRMVEQFSRDRSQWGSTVISGTPEGLADAGVMPGPLNGILEGDTDEQMADGGGEEVHILGMGAEKLTAAALDAPLVHLAGAKELSDEVKLIVPVAMDKGLRW